MPLVLSQELLGTPPDDVVGKVYHYPKQYWGRVKPGELFLYYHPAERGDDQQYYFGVGRLGAWREDPQRVTIATSTSWCMNPFRTGFAH